MNSIKAVRAGRVNPGRYHRSSIVIQPQDRKLIDQIKQCAHISSQAEAIRFALRAAWRQLERNQILAAYARDPESSSEIHLANLLTKVSAVALEKEKW